MKYILIISGSGGQGVMSVCMMLGESAVEGGLNATFMPLYGPEQRGGSAKCTVIISDEKIMSPLPKQSDGLIAMNETSFKKFNKELKPGGVMVINSNRVTSKSKRTDINLISVPADDLAKELGNHRIANIILIGALMGYSEMMDPKLLMDSLEKKFAAKGEKVVEVNRKALYKGVELGRAAKA